MRKYFVLLAAVSLYLCLGANYTWSVFAQELKTHYNFTMTQSQAAFSVFQLAFPVAFIIGGRLLNRFGPVFCASLGSLLFGGGFALAGLLPLTSMNLVLTFGLISGAGLGIAYAAPIYASQKNFPDKISIVTGIAVGAIAFSTVLLSIITEYLLKQGWDVSKILLLYGILLIILGCLASLGLYTKMEKESQIKNNKKVKLNHLITSKTYWALIIPFFAGLFSGLMIFSNIKTIGLQWEISPEVVAIGLPLIALFNATGRITWGYIAHISSEEFALKISLISQSLVLILGAFFLRTSFTFILFAILAGFNYGSNLVLFPSLTSKIWGVEEFGRIYPFILLVNAFSGFISPSFGGKISDITGNYFWALIFAGTLCIIAFIVFRNLFHSKYSPTQVRGQN